MKPWLRRTIILSGLSLLLGAIFKEFSQPRGLRVGEGKVLGVPYSLRLPNGHDLRQRYWNAEGSPVAPPLLGVGFYPNIPALLRKLQK